MGAGFIYVLCMARYSLSSRGDACRDSAVCLIKVCNVEIRSLMSLELTWSSIRCEYNSGLLCNAFVRVKFFNASFTASIKSGSLSTNNLGVTVEAVSFFEELKSYRFFLKEILSSAWRMRDRRFESCLHTNLQPQKSAIQWIVLEF